MNQQITNPVNILLVDDESLNLDALESFLKGPDYNLVRATSGEQALLHLLNGEFAAIVLDVQLPGMTGIELANLIKQRKRTSHIPIIFLTAYYQEDKDRMAGYGIGAVDYLTKPINPQILKSKLGVFVDLFRKTRALAEMNATLELEIVQRQNAEEALRQVNSELESRVHSRTADLIRLNAELMEREAALRASEAQLRLVTDHAPVFIVQLDRKHCFKFVNRTYARSFGKEPQDLLGKHFTYVMGEEAYDTIKKQIDLALEGQRVEFEVEIAYAELGPRWVYVIHEPERTETGEVVGLVAVVTDITERKQAEQMVAQARDKALAASTAKDNLLAALSHELRTPLNPVLLLATESANNTALPIEVRADFEMIARNVALEARLIDDLLDITAITRGKVNLKKQPIDAHTVLQEAIEMVRAELDHKKLSLDMTLVGGKHYIHGDEVRIKQVFWNVLKNAAKFTPECGCISVKSLISNDSNEVMVEITDSGIGMTTEELNKIFEAFVQGDHVKSGGAHKFGGLGLGLSISKMMVELHSGSISASSKGRNHGTTMTIKLPLLQKASVVLEPNCHTPEAAPTATIPPKAVDRQRRILLVEDHKSTASTITHLLKRRNYDVTVADCLSEARRIFSSNNFDILISDIGLPDGTGDELMREVRHKEGLIGIALTGYGMEEDMNRTKAAGFSTHLTKPVSVHALDNALVIARKLLEELVVGQSEGQ